MLYISEFMIILLWSSFAPARSSDRDGDPCDDYNGEYGTPFRFADPYNCKKYWMCVDGHKSGSHFRCPAGTSFTTDLGGSCNGPPPFQIKGCWKSEGF